MRSPHLRGKHRNYASMDRIKQIKIKVTYSERAIPLPHITFDHFVNNHAIFNKQRVNALQWQQYRRQSP